MRSLIIFNRSLIPLGSRRVSWARRKARFGDMEGKHKGKYHPGELGVGGCLTLT
jgi:hypothetical protein